MNKSHLCVGACGGASTQLMLRKAIRSPSGDGNGYNREGTRCQPLRHYRWYFLGATASLGHCEWCLATIIQMWGREGQSSTENEV